MRDENYKVGDRVIVDGKYRATITGAKGCVEWYPQCWRVCYDGPPDAHTTMLHAGELRRVDVVTQLGELA